MVSLPSLMQHILLHLAPFQSGCWSQLPSCLQLSGAPSTSPWLEGLARALAYSQS